MNITTAVRAVAVGLALEMSTLTFAGTITGVKVEPANAVIGVPVRITVSGDNEGIICGLRVEYGNGDLDVTRMNAGKDDFPRSFKKTYNKAGTYTILAKGARDGSATGCAGEERAQIIVGEDSVPSTESSPECPKGYTQDRRRANDKSDSFTCTRSASVDSSGLARGARASTEPNQAGSRSNDSTNQKQVPAAMERVGTKSPQSKQSDGLVSEALCGKLLKNRASLSRRSGSIPGCKSLMRNGRSSIVVDNSRNSTAVLIKIYPAGVSESTSLRVFTVRAGDSWVETNIAKGIYELRYEDLVTGSHSRTASLELSEEYLDDRVRYSRMRVTLYKVVNGNMKTTPIAANDFND